MRTSTLRELRFQVSNHLQIPILDIVSPSQECNCSFARQIDERALRSESNPGNKSLPNPLRRFIVVHGQSRVQIFETEATDKISLVEVVRQELGEAVRSKEMNFIGGTTVPEARQATYYPLPELVKLTAYCSEKYSKLPVISICSTSRHGDSSGRGQGTDARSDLDLHTSEAPIQTSSLNIDLTIDELGLVDYAVNGVLDIFVVERKISLGQKEGESGKDAIFTNESACVSWN